MRLDRFETFHAVQLTKRSDLTGAHVVSDRPVGVLSGNRKVSVPPGDSSADHLTEMLTPVATWGRRFLTSSTPDRNVGDVFRVLASERRTVVTLSGGSHFTIDRAGDFVVSRCDLVLH